MRFPSVHADPGEVQHLILHSALRDETKSWIALTSLRGCHPPFILNTPLNGPNYVEIVWNSLLKTMVSFGGIYNIRGEELETTLENWNYQEGRDL